MPRVLWWMAAVFLLSSSLLQARRASHQPKTAADILTGTTLSVGPLQFTVPAKWVSVPVENSTRAGQWVVPPPRGQTGDECEVVVFYFGPGIGGTAKANIDGWMHTMFNAEGHPAAAEVKTHSSNGLKISQVVVFGTYSQVVPISGIPPVSKPNYGLIGTVVEHPQGNVYWRFTGPEALLTADLPLFNKVIDSVRPATK